MTRPRIIGLLQWWDESPLWLAATITSAAPHIDHLVAVDGRYFLYPGDATMSRSDQAAAIMETCQAAGIGLTLHRPNHPWFDNEVEKRTRMFDLAAMDAEHGTDWYLVLDADEIVDRAPHDLHQLLADTEHDVAQVMFWERGDPYRRFDGTENTTRLDYESRNYVQQDSQFPVRILFRATPGLHCDGSHYRYRAGDGRLLWGDATDRDMVDALDLSPLFRVEHRTHYRPKSRHDAATDYYKRRDSLGVEKRDMIGPVES